MFNALPHIAGQGVGGGHSMAHAHHEEPEPIGYVTAIYISGAAQSPDANGNVVGLFSQFSFDVLVNNKTGGASRDLGVGNSWPGPPADAWKVVYRFGERVHIIRCGLVNEYLIPFQPYVKTCTAPAGGPSSFFKRLRQRLSIVSAVPQLDTNQVVRGGVP